MTTLKHILEMEEILAYIMNYLEEDLPVSRTAEYFQYNEAYFSKKFSDYFGMPYGKFLAGLRLRKAAEEITEGKTTFKEIARKYGYGDTRSFSKAFKREIGMSPRQFREENVSVPDMPVRESINGHSMKIQYLTITGFQMAGRMIRPGAKEKQPDILEECAYPFEYDAKCKAEGINLKSEILQIGMWLHTREGEIYYFMGPALFEGQPVPEGMELFDVTPGEYAVFSVERDADRETMLKIQRLMVRYAVKEWRMMNRKETDRMAFTFEAFDKNYTYFCLPLVKGMLKQSTREEKETRGIDKWIDYIDGHITEDISVHDIAMSVHYSETHFREIFKSYYGMSPAEYIRKRRLFLAADEIKKAQNQREIKKAANKYHFHSEQTFREQFYNEFQVSPEEYAHTDFKVINLDQYYSAHKEQIRVTFCEETETKMAGISLRNCESEEEKQGDLDIPGLAGYFMIHDTEPVKKSRYSCKIRGQENNMALWAPSADGKGYDYIIGPVVESFDDLPEEMEKITVEGGRYAVFETLAKRDENNLAESYRMLSRLVFFGWVKENRVRVNLSKPTYVRYFGQKLRFYVPVYS